MIWKKAKLIGKGKKLISRAANGAEVTSDNGKLCLFTDTGRRAFWRSGIFLHWEDLGSKGAISWATECPFQYHHLCGRKCLIHSISVMIPFFTSIPEGKGDSKKYVIFSITVSCVRIIIYSPRFQIQNQTWTTYQQETRVSFQIHNEITVLLQHSSERSSPHSTPHSPCHTVPWLWRFWWTPDNVNFLNISVNLCFKGDRTRAHLAKIMLPLCTPRNYMC